MAIRLICFLSLLFSSAPLIAQDWPQWRGPELDNISRESGWSSEGAELPLWKAQVGMGYSTPVIAGGRLLTVGYFDSTTNPGQGLDRVQCLDALTGEVHWQQAYPASIYANEHAGGVVGTPTIGNGTAYVLSRDGGLRAFSMDDGSLNWEVDLVERHQVDPGRYGFSSSPYLLGNKLVVNLGRSLCLHRVDGATVWITKEDLGAPYSTARPIELERGLGLVIFGKTGVHVIDANSGELWMTQIFNKVPRNVEGATPIVEGTRVFISSGYDHGGQLIDFGGQQPELLWATRRMRTKMAGSTLYQGHYYGFDESMLECLDMEGKLKWRLRGLGFGALSIADERLLVTSSEGELVVAKADPNAYVELARRQVIGGGGVFWASPVLSHGCIYVRGSLGDLVCLDHRKEDVATPATAGLGPEKPTVSNLAKLIERHRAAVGLRGLPPKGISFEGRLQIKSLGLADVACKWQIGDGGRWRSEYGLPPGMEGKIVEVFDGQLAWTLHPFFGDSLTQDATLDELRRTQGHQVFLDPIPPGSDCVVVGKEIYRGVPCTLARLRIAEGVDRHLYFDTRTGLLFAHTAPEESTVLFSDWRQVDGLTLPFGRTLFHPGTGEEARWIFREVQVGDLSKEFFVMPKAIAELLEAQRAASNTEPDGDKSKQE